MKEYFTIKSHYPSGFDISIGVGKLFWAKDLKAVRIALEHYFRNPSTTGHINNSRKDCPLCFNK